MKLYSYSYLLYFDISVYYIRQEVKVPEKFDLSRSQNSVFKHEPTTNGLSTRAFL